MANDKTKSPLSMLVTIFLGYTCIYVDKNVIGISVVEIARDLQLDASQKGMILSAFFLGYTALQIPFGYLSSRIGTRKILIMAIFLVGLFLIAFGFGFSLLYLLVIRFLTGALGHAGYPSGVSTFISQELPEDKKGPAQSAMIASSGFAAIVGPLIVAPLMQVIGWKQTYFILGIVVVLVALLMVKFIPKEFGGVKPEIINTKSLSFFEVLKDRNVWILILAAFFINGAIYGLNGWLASFIIDLFNLSLVSMAGVSAIIGFFTMIAAIVGGLVVNKFFKGKEKQVIFVACLICGSLILLMSRVNTLALSITLLTIVAGSSSVAFATLMTIPVKLFKQSDVSMKYATINALGVFGGFVAPVIIGKLVDASQGSYATTFTFLSIVYVTSGLIALFVKNKTIQSH